MSISDVYVPVAEITSHSALVTWSTSSPASSQVFYDETFHVTPAEYGSCTDFESSLIRNHGIFLEGLEANKTYHFRVQSTANMGGIDITCYSDDYTFDTLYAVNIRGGGGGGSSNRIFLAEYMNPPGTFGRDVSLRAYDGICTLIIPKGTVGKTPEGWALSYIILKPLQPEDEKPPSPQVGGLASRIYHLEPDGVTFSPAVTIYMLYKENEIPSGFGEGDLRIGYWDKGQGRWVALEGCKVDVEKNAVTAPLSHFSYYALLAVQLPPPEPPLFQVSKLVILPTELEEGQSVEICVVAGNEGGSEGEYLLQLKLNEEVRDSRVVRLVAGENREVKFNLSNLAAGEYVVDINGLFSRFVVRPKPQVLALPEPPVQTIPSQTPETTNTIEVLEPVEQVEQVSTPSEQEEPRSLPILVIIIIITGIAVIGIVAGTMFWQRKRRI